MATVGVVGGSIAGCAAAIASRRAGCEVTVFERTRGALKDRGAGIAIPQPLHEQLIAARYLDPAMPVLPCSERIWMVRHGDDRVGRVLWRQPSPAVLNNWALLWRTLRARVPDDVYREGVAVGHIEADDAGVVVVPEAGPRQRFDVLVGADGYRSRVRSLVHPGSRPAYAGYVLWRGNYEEGRLADRGPLQILERSWMTLCFSGGHGVFYLIPDFGQGQRRLNWAIYSAAPVRFDDPASVPPGSVSDELVAFFDNLLDEHLPAYWAEVVRLTDARALSVQPVYDEALESYASGRVVLIGDAGTVTRPHTASGATKALQDALALERAWLEHDTWDEALAAYDAERCSAGNELVELGRRIGRAQVEETPDWHSMTAADLDAWTRDTLAGQRHYLYDKGG